MGLTPSKNLETELKRALRDHRSRFSRLDRMMWQEFLIPYVVGPSFRSGSMNERRFDFQELNPFTMGAYHLTWDDKILFPLQNKCFIFSLEKDEVKYYLTEYEYRFHDEQVFFRWLKTKSPAEGEYVVNWRKGHIKIVPGNYQYQNGYFQLKNQCYDLDLQPLPVVDLFTLPRGRIYHNKYPNILPKHLREKIILPSRLSAANNKLMVTQEGNILLIVTLSSHQNLTIFRLYSPAGQLILAREWNHELLYLSQRGHWYYKHQNEIRVNQV